MALILGTRLGPYEILSALGAGGMGEVYRARDTKLNRDVAIKVLPEAFALDSDRVARFKREAHVLASLNHPNIGGIHGLEESSGITALVLELVEGPTIADRIAQGPIPLEDALPIAKQIVDALEAAHEHGIIHRDLKPANIKLRPDGTVKVLDFGLAKAMEPAGAMSPAWQSPTITTPAMTQAGIILGTAAYMSPEQAKGKQVDKRADVWAFGAVVFEMLTGANVFAGGDVSDTLAYVLTKEIDWTTLPAATPAALRRLLRRCLERDPKHRLRDIGDARLDLDEAGGSTIAESGSTLAAPQQHKARRARWTWAIAASGLAAVLGVWSAGRLRIEALQSAMRFTVPIVSFEVALSPDGRQLAYIEALSGTSHGNVLLRRLDSTTSRPLAGLSGGNIAWSPDSLYVAVSGSGRLVKVNVQNEQIQLLANLPLDSSERMTRGITWSDDDRILFSAGTGLLYQVPASGGEPTPVTTLNADREEVAHLWPQFLPDNRHFIFLVQSGKPQNTGIHVGSLDSRETKLLVQTDLKGAFARPGYLLFLRGNALIAQAMDPRTMGLTGEPSPVANGVGSFAAYGAALFSTSDTGILVYSTRAFLDEPRQLLWFDRAGTPLGTVGEPARGFIVNLSPDEQRVATSRYSDEDVRDVNTWLTDLVRNVSSPFDSERTMEVDPQWAPNGTQIAFSSDRNGPMALFVKSLKGGPAELLHASDTPIFMSDWSSDGRYVLYHQTGGKFFGLPMFGDREPVLVLDTPSLKDQAQFSPDTRWIAYNANGSGRFEVYVTSFPGSAEEIRVSRNGGVQPRWRADRRELFFLDLEGRLMSVEVQETGDRLEFGVPRELFRSRVEASPEVELYDVTRDGKRFLMMVPVESESLASQANVIVNWPSVLTR